jgi:hypothetical protein
VSALASRPSSLTLAPMPRPSISPTASVACRDPVGRGCSVRYDEQRGRHLRTATTIAALLVLLATLRAATLVQPVARDAGYGLIVPLAIAAALIAATALAAPGPGSRRKPSSDGAESPRG